MLTCPEVTGPFDGVVFSSSGGVLPFAAIGVRYSRIAFRGLLLFSAHSDSAMPGVGVAPGGSGLALAFGEVDELVLLLFWQATAKANASRTIKQIRLLRIELVDTFSIYHFTILICHLA